MQLISILTPKIMEEWKLWFLQACPFIYLRWDFRNFWLSPVWNIQFDELNFFLSLNKVDIFTSSNWFFFSSFWARVKYFDGHCLTIYSVFTIYRDIHYQLLVWWIHYTQYCESNKWKSGKFHLCSFWNDIFNYSN